MSEIHVSIEELFEENGGVIEWTSEDGYRYHAICDDGERVDFRIYDPSRKVWIAIDCAGTTFLNVILHAHTIAVSNRHRLNSGPG